MPVRSGRYRALADRGNKLAKKSWDVLQSHFIFSTPDKAEIYFIGTIYTLYVSEGAKANAEPAVLVFSQTLCWLILAPARGACVLAPETHAAQAQHGGITLSDRAEIVYRCITYLQLV